MPAAEPSADIKLAKLIRSEAAISPLRGENNSLNYIINSATAVPMPQERHLQLQLSLTFDQL